MSLPVSGLVIDDLALAVVASGDDGHGPGLAQGSSQGVGIIALVGQDVAGVRCAGEKSRGDGDVRDVAGRQDEREGASDDVSEGVELGGLTATRRADRLDFGPPFPPKAERWALT